MRVKWKEAIRKGDDSTIYPDFPLTGSEAKAKERIASCFEDLECRKNTPTPLSDRESFVTCHYHMVLWDRVSFLP